MGGVAKVRAEMCTLGSDLSVGEGTVERADGRGRTLHSGPLEAFCPHAPGSSSPGPPGEGRVWPGRQVYTPHYLLRMPVVSTLLIQIPPRFAKSSCLLITVPAPPPFLEIDSPGEATYSGAVTSGA